MTSKLSPHEKQSLLAHIIRLYEFTDSLETTTPCNNCEFLKVGTTNMCLKWGETVPKEHLATGCQEFKFNKDSMPF